MLKNVVNPFSHNPTKLSNTVVFKFLKLKTKLKWMSFDKFEFHFLLQNKEKMSGKKIYFSFFA